MLKRVEVVDRVQVAHTKLLEGLSCTAVVAFLAEIKGIAEQQLSMIRGTSIRQSSTVAQPSFADGERLLAGATTCAVVQCKRQWLSPSRKV